MSMFRRRLLMMQTLKQNVIKTDNKQTKNLNNKA